MGSEHDRAAGPRSLLPVPGHVLIAYYIFVLMSPLRVCLWDQNQMQQQRHVHLSKVKPRSEPAPSLRPPTFFKLQIRSIKRVNRKCRDARLGG